MIGLGSRYRIMPLRNKRRGSSWRRRFLDRMPSFHSSASSLPVEDDTIDPSPFESDWRDSIEAKHEARDDLALLKFKLL